MLMKLTPVWLERKPNSFTHSSLSFDSLGISLLKPFQTFNAHFIGKSWQHFYNKKEIIGSKEA